MAMPALRLNSILVSFLEEERPGAMLILFSILVVVLHIKGIIWLLSPIEQAITPAQPSMMEVSMIAISAPKASSVVTPISPRPIKKNEPQKPKPPEPKKPAMRPVHKKLPPVKQKTQDFAPSEQPHEALPIKQTTPAETSSETDNKPAISTKLESFTEANFKANYLHNPKPDYPAIARNRGWQGKVMLRVRISAEGLSETVEVETSSGHEILDESALEAVKKWRFVPAKHGETAVASSVVVPIDFHISEQ